jgi:hypothetical protein
MSYQAALKRAKGNVANCDDAALMASLLDGTAQLLLGAVSPKLIWEGAQAKGLTTLQLAEMINDRPNEAADLMWVET